MAELKEVKGIGPKSLMLLNKLNIHTIEDLVTYYPFRYEKFERANLALARRTFSYRWKNRE